MFIKKNKLTITLYSPVGQLIDLFPPVKTKDLIPNWYNALPVKSENATTVKHCPGFKDLVSKGFILPLWADHEIIIGPVGDPIIHSTNTTSGRPPSASHSLAEQAPGAWPNYLNIKFHCPWLAWCDEPIGWAWSQPVWHQTDPQELINVTAVSEFRHQHDLHINTIFKRPIVSKTISIKAGTPMAQLIPLTERDWDIKLEMLTPEIFSSKFAKWSFMPYSSGITYQKIRTMFDRKK
jgi:hypothetical protein